MARGIVVSYAPKDKQIELREKIILKNWRRGCYGADVPRITFIRVLGEKEKTELWIVPKGAEEPKIKSEAYKFAAITGLNYSDCKTIREFIQEGQGSFQTHTMVLYGSNFEGATRNLRKRCSMEFRGNYGGPRFSIMNGGFRSKQLIELWIVS